MPRSTCRDRLSRIASSELPGKRRSPALGTFGPGRGPPCTISCARRFPHGRGREGGGHVASSAWSTAGAAQLMARSSTPHFGQHFRSQKLNPAQDIGLGHARPTHAHAEMGDANPVLGKHATVPR